MRHHQKAHGTDDGNLQGRDLGLGPGALPGVRPGAGGVKDNLDTVGQHRQPILNSRIMPTIAANSKAHSTMAMRVDFMARSCSHPVSSLPWVTFVRQIQHRFALFRFQQDSHQHVPVPAVGAAGVCGIRLNEWHR